jgi:tetratricopeptide (TPR) repeat protein
MVKRLFTLVLILSAIVIAGFVGMRLLIGQDPLKRAMAMMENRNPVGAQVVLRTLIKAEPRNVRAHVLLAQKELKIARALKFDRAVLMPMLARTYLAQDRYADVLAEVPATAPRPEDLVLNLVLRSMAYMGLGDLGQAKATIEAAADVAPDSSPVLMQAARIALARKNPLEAERSASRALSVDPDNIDALMLQSEIQSQKWDSVGAIMSLNRAVALAPFYPTVRLARANLLINAGLDKQAQADVDAVLTDLSPQNATALYYNAVLMYRAKRYADAGVEFEKLGSLMSYFPKSYLYRGQAALALNQTEAALDSFYRYVKLQPSDPEGVRQAAQLEFKVGRPEKVVELVVRAAGAGLRDAQSFDMLGRAYFTLGQVPDAIETFKRAMALAPDNKEYATHLAAAQTQFGQAPSGPDAKAVE